jgi:CheY-like chemotaxis protein
LDSKHLLLERSTIRQWVNLVGFTHVGQAQLEASKELGNVPIVALTANHKDFLHEHVQTVGCTDLIPKPVELEKPPELMKKHLP